MLVSKEVSLRFHYGRLRKTFFVDEFAFGFVNFMSKHADHYHFEKFSPRYTIHTCQG